MTDNTHCGVCGQACGVGQTCQGGSCACQAGLTLCNGACTNTASDALNCGQCNIVCDAGLFCSQGQCTDECAAGLTPCGQNCVDIATDLLNCRACGNACAAGRECLGACPAAPLAPSTPTRSSNVLMIEHPSAAASANPEAKTRSAHIAPPFFGARPQSPASVPHVRLGCNRRRIDAAPAHNPSLHF